MNPEKIPSAEAPISYEELKEKILALGITNMNQYMHYIKEQYNKGNELNWPISPSKELEGWVSPEDFFPKKEEQELEAPISYEELKEVVRALGVNSLFEYQTYLKENPEVDLPFTPSELEGFVSLDDLFVKEEVSEEKEEQE